MNKMYTFDSLRWLSMTGFYYFLSIPVTLSEVLPSRMGIPLIFILFFHITESQNFITNERGAQVGDSVVNYCLAKILSLKYKDLITYTYTPFIHSEIFVFDDNESRIDINHQFSEHIRVFSDDTILNNIHKNNVLFICNLETRIENIDPSIINFIKKEVQLKQKPTINEISKDIITVAVHIRKGNGGGQFFDGYQNSYQVFNFDRTIVKYINNYFNHPFDWESYKRNNGKVEHIELENYKSYSAHWNYIGKPVDCVDKWQTKFPPDQFYIDQIKYVSDLYNNQKLCVQIFTDDKNPKELFEKIKQEVNLPNIDFHYAHYRNLSFKEKVSKDLYAMTRFDILIRSQSYFSRLAELMGNHRMVIYPLEFEWQENKLIMNKIIIKNGSN